MKEVLNYIPVLAVLVVINILLGTIYNTDIQNMTFDKMKLLNGLKKAVSIGAAFLGLAYTFSVVDLGGEIVTPQLIMTAAITVYASKATINLMKILGVDGMLTKTGDKEHIE